MKIQATGLWKLPVMHKKSGLQPLSSKRKLGRFVHYLPGFFLQFIRCIFPFFQGTVMKKERFSTAEFTITRIGSINMRHLALICRDAVIAAARAACATFLRFPGMLCISTFRARNQETIFIHRNTVIEKH